MKKIFNLITFTLILLPTFSYAGRTGPTKINSIVIKSTHVEIYTASNGTCSGESIAWDLVPSNNNYQALLSGFLATKAAEKEVDLVGIGDCENHNTIDWAYVLI